MSRMISELIDHVSSIGTRLKEVTDLRILFPEPAIKPGVVSGKYDQVGDGTHTFSVNP